MATAVSTAPIIPWGWLYLKSYPRTSVKWLKPSDTWPKPSAKEQSKHSITPYPYKAGQRLFFVQSRLV